MLINYCFRNGQQVARFATCLTRAARVDDRAHEPGMSDMSTHAFEPIEGVGFYCRTMRSAAPVAARRERGVDLAGYYKSELQAYVDAGPASGEAARHVRAQIFERRGGVLPRNWTVVEHYKANLDLLARFELKGGV